ncbi:cytochrome P450 monooxygenase [Amylocystis lapponica]|nr:cytochrome P450 monooxygenase [Amylocystis lapponica]
MSCIRSTFVRLAPNHVSIAAPAALSAVYGHSSKALKSQFYDTFVTFKPGLFSATSRTVHTRKRRIMSHIELCGQWDELCKIAVEGDKEGIIGTTPWKTENGRVWFNCVSWLNYFTFDTIGELAFGEQLGMVRAGRDSMKVVKSLEAGMNAYDTSMTHKLEMDEIPAIATLAKRTEIIIVLAYLPAYWRPLALRLPVFAEGVPTLRSDTVSMSASATIYYVSRDRRRSTTYKHLPYLEAVINEGLRLYSAVGGGLPRVVPEGGLTVLGHTFKEGSVLSVPSFSVHRDPSIWGDAQGFSPFSLGPRACIGRNLAMLELFVIIATVYHRYDCVITPGQKLMAHDGFVRKALGCTIGIKRRHSA